MPKIHTRFDLPDAKSVTFNKPTMTQQHFKDECDVNNILRNFMRTGIFPQPTREQMYGDFTNMPDLREYMDTVNQARNDFLALPSHVRKLFDNDPAQLVDYLSNPDNHADAVNLGLLPPPEPATAIVQAPLEGGGADITAPAPPKKGAGTTTPPAAADEA